MTRTRCTELERHPLHWNATLSGADGSTTRVSARCLVNAAGPWAAGFLQQASGTERAHALRLTKGSHIVVKRLFDHPYAYIFQHPDGRIVFAIPYERDFTLIGTTDLDYRGDPDKVAITPDEIEYLCALANRYFARPISAADVVWSYSGVRPLVEDDAATASAATRDFRLEHDTAGAPMLTVFGGKITTFRKLAEEALDWIAPILGNRGAPWTADASLPGGDLFGERPSRRGVLEFDQWVNAMQQRYRFLSPPLVARYARAYGTRMTTLLAHCSRLSDLGPEIVPGLYAAEADYLMTHEWAKSAEDILWRRTKLGLHQEGDVSAALSEWMASHQR
jgi:glycerol-3-phosphate dehydrogenase